MKIEKKSTEQALELLRSQLVYAMRTGDVFVINLDKWLPDFYAHFTHKEIFPSSLVLN